MNLRFSKKLAALAVGTGIVLTASAAFAYWTSLGSGSGAATGGALTPGGPTDTIGFSVKNNNSGHQKLNKVDISVANITRQRFDSHGDPVLGTDGKPVFDPVLSS